MLLGVTQGTLSWNEIYGYRVLAKLRHKRAIILRQPDELLECVRRSIC